MQATFKQLRHETAAVIRAVERGEKVIVTYRGKPVAEMTPIEKKSAVRESRLFGVWKDNRAVASVDAYLDRLRKGRFA